MKGLIRSLSLKSPNKGTLFSFSESQNPITTSNRDIVTSINFL